MPASLVVRRFVIIISSTSFNCQLRPFNRTDVDRLVVRVAFKVLKSGDYIFFSSACVAEIVRLIRGISVRFIPLTVEAGFWYIQLDFTDGVPP